VFSGNFSNALLALLFHPQVKGKDCEDFRHTARTWRYPIKCWAGTMALLSINTKSTKTIRYHRSPHILRTHSYLTRLIEGTGTDERHGKNENQT
jgi:hypothetical protein